MPALKRVRHRWWILVLLVIGVMVGVVWVSSRGESRVARLKAELEAEGEHFTLEALGLQERAIQEPIRDVLEAVMPRFKTIAQAQIDPTEGWKFEPARAEPPQVGWQQPFLYSCRRQVLEWDLAVEVADDLRPELTVLHTVLRDWVPPSGGDRHVEVEVIQEMQRLIERSRLLAQGRPMNTQSSLRMDDVTALEVLQRLLRANRLRLERDPKGKIHRITL